jgi:hypothetical protein
VTEKFMTSDKSAEIFWQTFQSLVCQFGMSLTMAQLPLKSGGKSLILI